MDYNEQSANAFEESWVQQAMAASLCDDSVHDEDLQRALEESAVEAESLKDPGLVRNFEHLDGGLSEDVALQRALQESAGEAEGPFFPAGLVNSGNSCFWNALLQALFAATPIFRGALFQLDAASSNGKASAVGETLNCFAILELLRDLFAEMDMGLISAIDAGALYRSIFQKAEEADVSEQMQKLFELIGGGPGALKAVCRELFSGDLYEQLKEGTVRRVPLDLCQLDLCITASVPLEKLLEEHTRDVQGSIERRSYRLPPVLWLNLDRFAYDREAQRGRKQQFRLTFPEVLNAWMLVPPDVKWISKIHNCAQRQEELRQALQANSADMVQCTSLGNLGDEEETLTRLVDQHEKLSSELQEVENAMRQYGAEQELLYQLQAVIVHRGTVDSGHYYTYTQSPALGSTEWCCLSDASVTLCSAEEMRRVCEGSDIEPDVVTAKTHLETQTPTEIGVNATTSAEPDKQNNLTADVVSPPTKSVGSEVVGDLGAGSKPIAIVRPAKPESKPRGFFSSLSSILGCLPHGGTPVEVNSEEQLTLQAEKYPSACPSSGSDKIEVVADGIILKGTSCLSDHVPAQTNEPLAGASVAVGSAATPATAEVASVKQEPSTAARCLVYVRSGSGGNSLVGEVKQRVSPALQERINASNIEFIRQNVEHVAEDFMRCVRHLTTHAAGGTENDDDAHLHTRLLDALRVAETIRTEGSMSHARIYLLRSCWLVHVPWLPEQLCPTAEPPDFRMHYGRTAKTMLLDALIKRGQHDVASLIVSGTPNSDAFVPKEIEDWLALRQLQP